MTIYTSDCRLANIGRHFGLTCWRRISTITLSIDEQGLVRRILQIFIGTKFEPKNQITTCAVFRTLRLFNIRILLSDSCVYRFRNAWRPYAPNLVTQQTKIAN